MKKIKLYLDQFHPLVWVLITGTIFIRCAAYMALPFLAIYLSNLKVSPILIGITIGISPLTGTVGGFIGGPLSDRFGRRPIMLVSMITLVFAFVGFSMVRNPVWFLFLNAIVGLSNSFFEPTSQALIADLTEQKTRMKAFSLRYTAINIGASVGPLIGAYLANVSPTRTFLFTGIIYLLYGIVLLLFFSRYKKDIQPKESAAIIIFADAVKIIKKDKALLYLILGALLIEVGFSQIESTLPQHLKNSIEQGVWIFSTLISVNAVMVVFLQMPISHFAEQFKPMNVMIIGAVLTSVGLLGFGITGGWLMAVLSMAVLTLGEILIFPSNSLLIDQLAPEHLRGTYFGANQFKKLGDFFGPMLGGYFLSTIGGFSSFLLIAILSLTSLFFFLFGNRALAIQTNLQVMK